MSRSVGLRRRESVVGSRAGERALRRLSEPLLRRAVESLEPRRLLAAVSWASAADGDWSNPANWSGGAVPTAADDVLINFPGVTVTHSTGSDAVNSIVTQDPLVLSGGTLAVAGTLQLGNTLGLQGGTLSGATITGLSNQIVAGGTISLLDGVTLTTDQVLADGANVNVTNGLTLSGASLQLASQGLMTSLFFTDAQTISGTGSIVLGTTPGTNNQLFIDCNTGNITIASGITIDGAAGTITATNASGNPVLQGTIASDSGGGQITLAGGAFINQGSVQAINGGTLTLNANIDGSIIETNSTLNLGYTLGQMPQITRTGGNINLTGTLDFFGGTAAFTSTTGSWNLAGGVVRNMHLSFDGTGDTLVITAASGTFSNVTLDSDLTVGGTMTVQNGLVLNGSTLTINSGAIVTFDSAAASQTLGGAGAVLVNGGFFISTDAGNNGLTVQSGITIHGAGLVQVGPADTFQGTVSADQSGNALTIDGTTFFNGGTLQAINGAILLLVADPGGAGTITETSSTIDFAGTLHSPPAVTQNGGAVLLSGTLDMLGEGAVFDDSTGVWVLVGVIENGPLTFTGAGGLVLANSPTLKDVSLQSDLTVPNGVTLHLVNQLTLDARLIIASDGQPTSIVSEGGGTRVIDGTGSIVFSGTVPSANQFSADTSAGSLTIGPNVTLFGAGGAITASGPMPLALQGVVSVNSTGSPGNNTLTITGPNIVYDGTLQAFGGVINIVGNASLNAVSFVNVLIGNGFAGQVNVSGNLSLAGQFNLSLANGFIPPVGSNYNVLSAGVLTGTFTGVSGLTSPSVVFSQNYTPTALQLTTVQGGPAVNTTDLSLSGITDKPGTYVPGGLTTVSFSANNGSPADVGPYTIQLDLSTDPFFGNADDIPLDVVTESGTPGTFAVQVTSAIPANIAAGNYYIVAETDSGNVVAETNETNNTSATLGPDIAIAPLDTATDLTLSNITYTGGTFAPGDVLSGTGSVTNSGPGDTPPFDVELVLSQDTVFGNRDDIVLQTATIGDGGFTGGSASAGGSTPADPTAQGLLPGEVSSGTLGGVIPATIAAGSYHVLVKADSGNAVAETNENNNIYVSKAADVVIPSPATPPVPKPVKTGGTDVNFGVGGVAAHDVGISSTADVAIQSDGKSVIVGTSESSGGGSFALTRYTATGSIDRDFGNNGSVTTSFDGRDTRATSVDILANGKILVAGTSTRIVNGVAAGSALALARYNSDGSLDLTFGGGTGKVLRSFGGDAATATSTDVAESLAVRPDGTILVAGSSNAAGRGTDFAIAAFTPQGLPSNSFGNKGRVLVDFAGGDDAIHSIAFELNGDIVAAGTTRNAATGVTSIAMARLDPHGSRVSSFGVAGRVVKSLRGIDDEAESVAIDPSGQIVVGGLSASGSATDGTLSTDFAVVRFSNTGRALKSFGDKGQVITSFGQPAAITSILIQNDGRIVASGKTASSLASIVPNSLDLALAQYNPDGSLDTSFGGTGKAILPIGDDSSTITPALQRDPSVASASSGSTLLNNFNALKATAQGALASNSSGELFDVGNDGSDTIEAAIVSNGVDLTGGGLSVKGNAVRGKSVTLSLTIHDVGNLPATGSVAAQIFAAPDASATSGTPLMAAHFSLKLKAGSFKAFSQKIPIPKAMTTGSFYVLAKLDPANTFTELDLTNNLLLSAAMVTVR